MVISSEKLTVAGTAVGLASATRNPSTGKVGRRAVGVVEDGPIRFTVDGTTPTSTTGHLRGVGDPIDLCGEDEVRSFLAIRTTGQSAVLFLSVYDSLDPAVPSVAATRPASAFDQALNSSNAVVFGGVTTDNIDGVAAADVTSAGGAVVITGAIGGATSGAGGAVSLTGGAGTNGNSAGGAASTTGGAGQGSAAGGVGRVAGGVGGVTGAGGAAQVAGGAGGATSGTGGVATLTGGAGTGAGAAGGAASVTGGVGVAHGSNGTGGVGGAGSVVGAAGGGTATGTGGAGGDIAVTGGAGGAASGAGTGGAGGSIVLTPGTGGTTSGGTAGKDGVIIERGIKLVKQGAQTAKTVSATLTAAEVLAGIITVNQGAGATSAQQLPAAADLDTALPDAAAGDAFDFSVINVSTVDAEDASVTTNTGWTLVGNMDVHAYSAAGSLNSSARFRARKTGSAAWTLYRLS